MMGNYHARCGAGEKPEVEMPEAYLSLFGQIPQFEKLIATIRSREISASIILQSQSQLKAIYKDGQLEKQQPEATPDSLLTGETVRTPRGNFHITDMSREQIEAAGFGFHHASEDGKYLIMGNGTQAYAIAAEQPQRDNPLKHVEDTIEQNDNNFDGLINNTPQTPTVADFEQRAKAGEAISVTDLAKAVKAEKREQPQKKPSILKKLDEYKKQAAQQPKDKQKEHKKDLEV